MTCGIPQTRAKYSYLRLQAPPPPCPTARRQTWKRHPMFLAFGPALHKNGMFGTVRGEPRHGIECAEREIKKLSAVHPCRSFQSEMGQMEPTKAERCYPCTKLVRDWTTHLSFLRHDLHSGQWALRCPPEYPCIDCGACVVPLALTRSREDSRWSLLLRTSPVKLGKLRAGLYDMGPRRWVGLRCAGWGQKGVRGQSESCRVVLYPWLEQSSVVSVLVVPGSWAPHHHHHHPWAKQAVQVSDQALPCCCPRLSLQPAVTAATVEHMCTGATSKHSTTMCGGFV